MIERLSGPHTHVCWTPDAKPKDEREVVSLVREDDLKTLEGLARGLAAWDKKWPKGTILPATLERQCNAELTVLCALAATLTNPPTGGGTSE